MLEELLEENRRYVEGYALAGLDPNAAKHVAILTCMDTRIEPLAMLGLRPGDAKILRNAGARATTDAVRSLALATHFLGVSEVVIVQHTRCALAGTDEEQLVARLAERGVDRPAAVSWLAMPDPDAALQADVALLRSSSLLAPGTRVEGWRYDVDDGSIRRLVPAAS